MSKATLPTRLKKIRCDNLKRLVAQAKSQITFAVQCELNPTHLNQMLSGHRGVGDKSAAKIEKETKSPPGWLDEDRSSLPAALSPQGIKAGLIYDQLSPDDKARYITAMDVAAETYRVTRRRGKGDRT